MTHYSDFYLYKVSRSFMYNIYSHFFQPLSYAYFFVVNLIKSNQKLVRFVVVSREHVEKLREMNLCRMLINEIKTEPKFTSRVELWHNGSIKTIRLRER